jgi:hypothetical protein
VCSIDPVTGAPKADLGPRSANYQVRVCICVCVRNSQYACTLVSCTLYVVRSTLLGQFSTCLQYAAVRYVCLSALLLLMGCVLAHGWLLVGLVFVKGCCNMWACL